uniref:guanylate cyclase n=1 Tax=Acrobeloides nanus TaxID=290746 RepID=A0A914DNP5_9BILA
MLSSKSRQSSRHTWTHFELKLLNKEEVVVEKHEMNSILGKHDIAEIRQMRQKDHDNLNKFIGLSIDGDLYLSVWKYCTRGSLKDIILGNTVNMDAFFIFSLIRDICEGLSYIHKSPLQFHGNLKSSTCLITNQIHISADANHFLTQIIGGYITQARGEQLIKGKGVMKTYWLIGPIKS